MLRVKRDILENIAHECIIMLEDGAHFKGVQFAGPVPPVFGEIVFNTSMSGYQEILTDPSYKGQIITMTYPLIGNYGVTPEDMESAGIHASAFIVKEYVDNYSNWRADASLKKFLDNAGIIGIQGVDTRALVRHIRMKGAMKGAIFQDQKRPVSKLIEEVRASADITGIDMVRYVTCEKPYIWTQNGPESISDKNPWDGDKKNRVVAFDFGIKYNILRMLTDLGCKVLVVPASTKAKEIIALNPNGVFLSNGPGDPSAVTYAIENIKKLIGRFPIFGICLGHQLLCLALGGKTFKLKFGHRGANHPVKHLEKGKVEITSQNHGFAVDTISMSEDITITHINLNDNTLEGIRNDAKRLYSVQYHPEASPGPHDAAYLFNRFIQMMDEL